MIDARLDPPSRRSIRVRLLLLALLPLGVVLPLLLAVLALSPLAEAAGALASPSDAAVIAVQILFGFWILYLTARGLKNIYATSAPKAPNLPASPLASAKIGPCNAAAVTIRRFCARS